MVKVIAHRGARSIAPENTLMAAEIAFKTGAGLWETDVNTTLDGHLILFHDKSLLRCTNAASKFPSRASYNVKDFSIREIMQLDAGSYFIDTDPFLQIFKGNISKERLASFKKAFIPTLEQGLLFTKKMNWKINLELKRFCQADNDTYIPDKTLEIIRGSGLPLNRVAISSFYHEWLYRVMKKEPEIEVQALVGENDTDHPPEFGDYAFPTYNINACLVDSDMIKRLKARGRKINLYTVNDPKEFSHFANLGVDGMFTDFPQLFSAKI
ncbi:MAG: hypothetical protein GXP56_02315 [Deltaproteobacteria bacterium]|nr:hypothetical protein [Deltaproteobacteria bacterium]